MRRSLRALLAIFLTGSLALPSAVAHAQQPATPPPQTDRDADGLVDDYDQCPDTPAATPSGCPEAAPPPPPAAEQPPPPVAAPAAAPAPQPAGDEYERLLQSLPNDYDINYSYTAADRKKKRENDPGRAAKSAKRLGIAGGSMLLIGTVGMITTLTTGLVMAKNAKDTIEEEPSDGVTPIDYDAREEALRKGEIGDKLAIGGSAASGGVMGIGVALMLAARGIRKKQYGAPVRSGSGMTDKTRRQLILIGAVLGIYGVIGLGAGAALVGSDDEKKSRNGKILLGTGGVLAGLGLLMIIPALINKARNKSARVTGGPMWVRGGGGGSLAVRF